ncbi:MULTISPECIES: hypothetical protein [Streptomyces]|uniref:hypothetical protein n=1 Tax=Streptomyces TaxID=1883 RepID=UPI00130060AE|nr:MULTISPECIES: hypothetical protein [Streptomyces]
MRNGLRNRKTARLAIVLAAIGMFAGGMTAQASAVDHTPDQQCWPVPGGWLCH